MRPHRNNPRQPVGWGALHEAPPPVIAPYIEARPADWLLLAILRPAWAYRLELSLIVLVAVAYVWLGGTLGRQDADRLIVAAAFVVALVGWTREPLARCLARSHVRRRWGWPAASVKAVQAQLGHASATVTLDRYGHLFPDELQRLADRLQEAYAAAAMDPARTEGSETMLRQSKGAGQWPAPGGGGGGTRTPAHRLECSLVVGQLAG
jgi:hypothetical protein